MIKDNGYPQDIPPSWLKVYECGYTNEVGKKVKIAPDPYFKDYYSGSSVYLVGKGHFNCHSYYGCVLSSSFVVGQEYEVKHLWKNPDKGGGTFAWLELVEGQDSKMIAELEKMGAVVKVSLDLEQAKLDYMVNTTPIKSKPEEIWWTYKPTSSLYPAGTTWVMDSNGKQWYTRSIEGYAIRYPSSFTIKHMDEDYTRILDPRPSVGNVNDIVTESVKKFWSYKVNDPAPTIYDGGVESEPFGEFDILDDVVDSYSGSNNGSIPPIKLPDPSSYFTGGTGKSPISGYKSIKGTLAGSALGVNKEVKFNGYIPKTQKSLGVIALAGTYKGCSLPLTVAEPIQIFKASSPLPDVLNFNFPKFARPCPLTPRHGFVDSRIVNTRAQLEVVIKETFEADPDGEVMIMDFLDSLINMVWTPALLTMGSGHDGATAGKDCLSFPLNGKYDAKIKSILSKAGIEDYPYVEAVIKDPGDAKMGNYSYQHIPVLTQLRNGPVLDTKPDYIPKKVVVTKVIKPDVISGDLLAWEEMMLANRGVDGVVVYHPTGSQADHFAIHARSCKIPCIITFKPTVGDILEPIKTIPPNYDSLIRGLVAGAKVELGKFGDYYGNRSWSREANSMLIALHNSPAMEGEQVWWLGAAISLMLRLGSMALRGESRHINENHGPRDVVYIRCAKTKLQAHARTCGSLINIFKYGWPYGKTGIGGLAWAQCGLALGEMFNSVRDFIKEQNDDTYGALIRSFNTAVNQAHNGGWWMNKFTTKASFDQAQQGDLKVLLDSVPFLWELGKVYNSLDNEKASHATRNWNGWPTVDLTPPRAKSVTVVQVPGSSWITITIIDSILKKKRIPVSINLKNLLKRVPVGWEKDFIIRETPDGMAVDVVFPGIIDEPINVWKEPKIKVQSTIA